MQRTLHTYEYDVLQKKTKNLENTPKLFGEIVVEKICVKNHCPINYATRLYFFETVVLPSTATWKNYSPATQSPRE